MGQFKRFLGSKVALIIATAAITAAFTGTVVYAVTKVVAPDVNGTIHACYKKGGTTPGKIRIVSAGTQCASSESALAWKTMSSIGQLAGTACTVNGANGTVQLSYDDQGVATFTCGDLQTVCGDSQTTGFEQCDDGNAASGDGCTSTCSVEAGYQCTGSPSVCSPIPEVCNGVDDNNNGQTDEGFNVGNACTAGVGACQTSGQTVCTANGQGVECNATPNQPTMETCNNIDDDCNGQIDDGISCP